MDDVSWLIASERIKQLKARYFYCADTRDWTGFEALFTDDAVMDLTQVAPPGADKAAFVFSGRTTIAKLVSRSLRDAEATVHHGHTPIIELEDDDTATGIWSMEDNLFFADGHRLGYGHYHERYRRTDEGWRICRLALTRIRTIADPFRVEVPSLGLDG